MSLLQKMPTLSIQKTARFTAVVAIAMAAGHLVQTLAARKPAPAPVVAAVVTEPTNIVQLSSLGTAEPDVVAVDAEQHIRALEEPSHVPDAAPDCRAKLAVTPGIKGMMQVALTAPCNPMERVVLRHAGLAVTGKIGPDGALNLTLPALQTNSAVEVGFADGSKVLQPVTVPDAAQFHRFAVQWQGADAFAIHALVSGADYGQPGDIWQDNPQDPAQAKGGFLTVLGDETVENPLLAEVYTYAAAPADILVEAAVLDENCGKDLLADVLESHDGRVRVTDLTLAMPECSGVGDFLVLKNLASDMKIAAK